MGHILWLEESDPVTALRKMNEAVETKPFNCAVWANAGDRLSDAFKQAIRSDRERNAIPSKQDVDIFYSTKDARIRLHNCFNRTQSGTTLLQQHIDQRLNDIEAALRPVKQNFQLRSSAITHDIERIIQTTHVDNYPLGDRRFIESLESESTYLIDNKDVYCTYDSQEMAPYRLEQRDWFLKPEGNVTFWQTPPNSLTLFTTTAHDWKPIMHAFPPTPPGNKEPQKRTVTTYDLSL